MQPVDIVTPVSNIPTFEPSYVNLDYVFYQIYKFLAFIFDGNQSGGVSFVSSVKLIIAIVAVLAIALIIYCLVRLWEIRKEAKEKEIENQVRIIEDESYGHTLRWQTVLDHAASDNPSDWRLAILEADTMLETASQRLPVIGETLGERLKKLDKGDLRTIDSAWEAHRVRNRIAHDGLEFEITKREANRVVGLFQDVLHELGALKD